MAGNKILVMLPTNFGDILLTLKAIELIKKLYSQDELYALCSPHTIEFVTSLGFFNKTELFDKNWTISTKFKYLSTFHNKFDVCIDFKHSLLPLIINSPVSSPLVRLPKFIHKSESYVNLVRKTAKAKELIEQTNRQLIPEHKINFPELNKESKYIFIAAGSKSALKQYPAKQWAELISRLEGDEQIVFIGAVEDCDIVDSIISQVEQSKLQNLINLIGKTSFLDLFTLFSDYAKLLICCDSAPMHVASYVDIPIIALFGPTDPVLYGPNSSKSVYIQAKHLPCIACMQSVCKQKLNCMKKIAVKQIIEEYEKF